MAPEQIRGETISLKIDIWAFGVILWSAPPPRRPLPPRAPPPRLRARAPARAQRRNDSARLPRARAAQGGTPPY